MTDPGYWVRQVRCPVRFADGVAAAREAGAGVFLELGPGGALSAMAEEVVADIPGEPGSATGALCVPLLRRDRDEATTALTALARAHVRGVDIDWENAHPPVSSPPVDLPTYAFQHRRYWPDTAPPAADAAGLGLDTAAHPLLGAVTVLPDTGGVLLTGLLSATAPAWLADHRLLGTAVVPGTALLELVARAGDEAGCDLVEELVNEVPLTLPGAAGVRVRVTAGAPDPAGRRTAAVYSRAEDAPAGTGWTRHATAALGVSGAGLSAAAAPTDLAVWPPRDAVELDVGDFYPGLAEAGHDYGPAFRGLRAAWRRGGDVFVEAELAEAQSGDAAAFGLHPALLDAVLQAITLTGIEERVDGHVRVPFAWRDVRLHASGASALRARLTADGAGGVVVHAADSTGAPVVSVGSLTSRPIPAARLDPGRGARSGALLRVEWTGRPSPAPCHGGPAPALLDARHLDGTTAEEVRAAATDVLGRLRRRLDAPGSGARTLVVLTRGAVSAAPDATAEPVDPVGAAVWGLVRSAQEEYPDRILLADIDGDPHDAVPLVLASGEPQVAVRGGRALVPRLARAPEPAAHGSEAVCSAPDPDGTVLVTGGTGSLGAVVARHMAARYGVRHLILAGRRGPDAPGAADLVADLARLGASARAVRCDVADRDALRRLLAEIPREHPLTGVVHLAGVLDDGLLPAQTPERLASVFRPKADAALHLDECTRDTDLRLFVLFSSLAGTLGSAGQATYAAANAYLDGIAQRRRAAGLPAVSVAWGRWRQEGGMTAAVAAGRSVVVDGGALPGFTPEEGTALLDAALRGDAPVAVAIEAEPAALAATADGRVPPLLRGLVRPARPASGTAATGTAAEPPLSARFAAMTETDRRRALIDLVKEHAAAVLGAAPEAIGAERAFTDQGFDSLTSVELRNRLVRATGVRLPAAVVFNCPTPAALAARIATELPAAPLPGGSAPPPDREDEVRRVLARVPFERFREAGVLDALLGLAGGDGAAPAADPAAEEPLAHMDADELVRRALGDLGT
ncbi:type I polyketide synthase [Nocardiopsis mangrovi]|uniref:Type I polyketide synthase n=1 Tax=Nocardiopsis mangrovi TaxID=1179818 RepID=A0ABV9E6Z4_9ACTN